MIPTINGNEDKLLLRALKGFVPLYVTNNTVYILNDNCYICMIRMIGKLGLLGLRRTKEERPWFLKIEWKRRPVYPSNGH